MDDDEEAHRKRKAPEGDEDQGKTSGNVDHLNSTQVLAVEATTQQASRSIEHVRIVHPHTHVTSLNKTPVFLFFAGTTDGERNNSALNRRHGKDRSHEGHRNRSRRLRHGFVVQGLPHRSFDARGERRGVVF